MSPAKMVKIAKARGLDAIAVTDHGEVKGAYEAREEAAKYQLPVIIGEELSTKAGDILGLFIKERITIEDPLEAIKMIHDQGGIAIMPHPFSGRLTIDERVAKAIDGCEGFNARHSKSKFIDNAIGEPDVASFALQYDLSLTASSDAHFYSEIGNARTIVEAKTLEEVKEAILRGETFLKGKRSHNMNLFASGLLKSFRYLINPVPEEKEL